MALNLKLPFRTIFTVSELTQEIKDLLEVKFSDIWVEGEVSNIRIPPSGHIYFTLKDDMSQIRAVVFRMQARTLRFLPEDGLHVVCRGRVTVYERRGEYQLILDAIEPKGIGALQLAFLQLKERLEREGLFDSARKKPIPMVPEKIGIVTSPTGAVIQDMIQIIQRRFERVHILIYPVPVQGEGASVEIAKAVDYFNEHTDIDVIIVGRGGGSTEDLWAFNEEAVARAIYRSRIPVISAVGHETDYTISDFVADLRAPTPSAAAELAVSDERELRGILNSLRNLLGSRILKTLEAHRSHSSYLKKGLISPRKRIENDFLRVDELASRLSILTSWTFKANREKWLHLAERISLRNPLQKIDGLRSTREQREKHLFQNIRYRIDAHRQKLGGVLGKLESLSPLSILQRGYSITRKLPSLQILRRAEDAGEGDRVEVRLYHGTLLCSVEKSGSS